MIGGVPNGGDPPVPWKAQSPMSLRLEFATFAARPDANVASLCRRFSIGRKTGYKWLARAAEPVGGDGGGGGDPLADRPRRPRRSPNRTDAEVERPAPNDLWQLDFKGHFPTDDGRRCHPLTAPDDHSRFNVLLRACPDERAATARDALAGAMRAYGVPRARSWPTTGRRGVAPGPASGPRWACGCCGWGSS